MSDSELLRMDNMGIVVESLDSAIAFFAEIGLRLEGRAVIEGDWAGQVTGLGHQQVEIAMMVTPDGHSKIELSQFTDPKIASSHMHAPVNALGYLRLMFAVTQLDELLIRLERMGAKLEGQVVDYNHAYRLCYIRSAEGLLVGLAEKLEAVSHE